MCVSGGGRLKTWDLGDKKRERRRGGREGVVKRE